MYRNVRISVRLYIMYVRLASSLAEYTTLVTKKTIVVSSAKKIAPLALSRNSSATFQEWKARQRSVLYYSEAKDNTESSRKKAFLLQLGGRELREEIFDTIEAPDSTAAKEAKDSFQFAINASDKHFEPTANKYYERYLIVRADWSGRGLCRKIRRPLAKTSG